MANILVYYPSNKRTVQLETLMLGIAKEGHQVMLLTLSEKGDLHNYLSSHGIATHTLTYQKKNPIIFYLKHVFGLVKFCKQKQVDFLFSNLQQANLIAIFGQFFTRTKVYFFRHHFRFFPNSDQKTISINKNEAIGDKLISKLATHIIVPSSGVLNGMIEVEKVSPKKLSVIPYIYDFDQYGKPDTKNVSSIIAKHSTSFRLIMVSRLIALKRHDIVFRIIKNLKEKELDIHLFVLDTGPEEKNLKAYIKEYGLENHISMLGFRRDFLDYMSASHMIIHPSLTEASNSAVKEMALMGKPAIVCKEVGDFDDYLTHGKTGFLCDRTHFQEEATEILLQYHHKTSDLSAIGESAKKEVLGRFSINKQSLKPYLDLLN